MNVCVRVYLYLCVVCVCVCVCVCVFACLYVCIISDNAGACVHLTGKQWGHVPIAIGDCHVML